MVPAVSASLALVGMNKAVGHCVGAPPRPAEMRRVVHPAEHRAGTGILACGMAVWPSTDQYGHRGSSCITAGVGVRARKRGQPILLRRGSRDASAARKISDPAPRSAYAFIGLPQFQCSCSLRRTRAARQLLRLHAPGARHRGPAFPARPQPPFRGRQWMIRCGRLISAARACGPASLSSNAVPRADGFFSFRRPSDAARLRDDGKLAALLRMPVDHSLTLQTHPARHGDAWPEPRAEEHLRGTWHPSAAVPA